MSILSHFSIIYMHKSIHTDMYTVGDSPLIAEVYFQNPRWIPETKDSTTHCFFLCIHTCDKA